jgi:beta-aspartyl-peptidase (threonine type)
MKSAFSLTVHGGAGDLDIVQHGEIADIIEPEGGTPADSAVAGGMGYPQAKGAARGGVIVIDRHGRCAAGWTTKRMTYGWIERGGAAACRL